METRVPVVKGTVSYFIKRLYCRWLLNAVIQNAPKEDLCMTYNLLYVVICFEFIPDFTTLAVLIRRLNCKGHTYDKVPFHMHWLI
jgi:hypothetical protein